MFGNQISSVSFCYTEYYILQAFFSLILIFSLRPEAVMDKNVDIRIKDATMKKYRDDMRAFHDHCM